MEDNCLEGNEEEGGADVEVEPGGEGRHEGDGNEREDAHAVEDVYGVGVAGGRGVTAGKLSKSKVNEETGRATRQKEKSGTHEHLHVDKCGIDHW